MRSVMRAEFEKVLVGERASFKVKEFRVPVFGRGWHFHPEIQLTYIAVGTGHLLIGDCVTRFGPANWC
jgi:hypothetical protein